MGADAPKLVCAPAPEPITPSARAFELIDC